nr:MAG TPA: hypothetical protein [Caudoviricetes sp.]
MFCDYVLINTKKGMYVSYLIRYMPFYVVSGRLNKRDIHLLISVALSISQIFLSYLFAIFHIHTIFRNTPVPQHGRLIFSFCCFHFFPF